MLIEAGNPANSPQTLRCNNDGTLRRPGVKAFVDTGIANLAISGVYTSPWYDLGPDWDQYSLLVVQFNCIASTGSVLSVTGSDDGVTTGLLLAHAWSATTSSAWISNPSATGNASFRPAGRYFRLGFTNGTTAAQAANSIIKAYAFAGI